MGPEHPIDDSRLIGVQRAQTRQAMVQEMLFDLKINHRTIINEENCLCFTHVLCDDNLIKLTDKHFHMPE